MVFSSTFFLFFFLPLLLVVYNLAAPRYQNAVLIFASLAYYSWGESAFLIRLVGLVMLNWWFGLCLGALSAPRGRKAVLALAVVVDTGVLVYFKYANFAVENLNALREHFSWHSPIALAPIALPLGISFFTFHVLSYVVDVYRNQSPAQRHPGLLLLYILFFPQLIAGPIVRYHEISAQLTERRSTAASISQGFLRFVVGLGKKVLLANAVGPIADAIWVLPTDQLTTGLAWLAVGSYSLQIYFDFSGYSDMAIGLARMFGFRFPENFNYPYMARSLTEFWRRWHLSLSAWFRDYLYIPLGGNRVRPWRVYFNLALVFLLCGLWHGASWNFVLWGAMHGALLVLERMGWGRLLARLWSPLRRAYCLFLVSTTWLVFRSPTLAVTRALFKAMMGHGAGTGLTYYPSLFLDQQKMWALALGVLGAAPVLPAMGRFAARRVASVRFSFRLLAVASAFVILVAAVTQLSAGTYNPFIYFRF